MLDAGSGRVQVGLTLAAFGVLRLGPAGQCFPGGGQVGVLDGGCAELDDRIPSAAQLGPGLLFPPR